MDPITRTSTSAPAATADDPAEAVVVGEVEPAQTPDEQPDEPSAEAPQDPPPTEAPAPIAEAPALRVDEHTLGAAFDDAGYEPPEGSFVMVGRELEGSATHFEWFSLGHSGLTPSHEHFWPASTIKVMTAIAALETLHEYGLTGAAILTFEDLDGRYHGPAKEIIRLAIQVSNNPAYNRTVLIAGMRNINETVFPRWGLHDTIMQRRYTRPEGVTDLALRTSPAIRYREGGRRGTIPERIAPHLYGRCPAAGNCTSLYELLSVMRRVTLHHELPAAERFNLSDEDVTVIHDALRESYSRIAPGAEAALGPVAVLNKTGTVPGDDALDHGLITDEVTGRRYLLAVSTRWHRERTARIGELTRQTLLAISGISAAR
ncbi:MAG: serine hydrolase [Deltaproteobacteria bacterium]|nr:serine hydrolase [Deltaproteobacteria bacterium]